MRATRLAALLILAGASCAEEPESGDAGSTSGTPAGAPRVAGAHALGSFFLGDRVLAHGVVDSPWPASRPAASALPEWSLASLPLERQADAWVGELPLPVARDEDERPIEVRGVDADGSAWTHADERVGLSPEPPETDAGDFVLVPAQRSYSFARHPELQRFPKPRTTAGVPGVKLVRPVSFSLFLLRTGSALDLRCRVRVLSRPDGARLPRMRVWAGEQEVGVLDWARARSEPGLELPPALGPQELRFEVLDVEEGRNAAQRLVLDRLELSTRSGRDRLWLRASPTAREGRLRYRPRREGFQRTLPGGARELRFDLAVDDERLAVVGPPGQELELRWGGETRAVGSGELSLHFEGAEQGSLQVRRPDGGALRGPIDLVRPRALADEPPAPLRGMEATDATEGRGALVRHFAVGDVVQRSLVLVPGAELRCPIPELGPGRLDFDLVRQAWRPGLPLPPSPSLEVLWIPAEGPERRLLLEPSIPGDWRRQSLAWPGGEGELCIRCLAHPRFELLSVAQLVALGDARIRQQTPRRAPNVLIYLIDTLRADHLPSYGYARDTAPQLRALAEDGVLFERCYSSAPWTRPSIASIFTGLQYSFHGAGKQSGLAPQLDTLAERLHDAGYQTAAFVANAQIHSEGLNFEQGFQRFEAIETVLGSSRSSDVNDRALPWLDAHAEQPFFLYLHTLDPHAKYDPPPETRGAFGSGRYSGRLDPARTDKKVLEGLAPLSAEEQQYLLDLYDEEILFNDQQFGRVLERLKALGVYEDTIVVVLSDHGEEFGGHGRYGHGGWLWQELLHVPMVWKLAGAERPRGRRVRTPASIVDVLPTLAGLLGLEDRGVPVHGEDLRPALSGEAGSELDVIAEEEPGMITLLRGDRKVIEEDRHRPGKESYQLFDLATDPDEQHDLSERRAEELGELRAELARILLERRGAMEPIQGVLPLELSEEMLQALKEMGYVDEDGRPVDGRDEDQDGAEDGG